MKIDCDLLLNVTDLTNIWLGYCKTSCKQISNNKKEAIFIFCSLELKVKKWGFKLGKISSKATNPLSYRMNQF